MRYMENELKELGKARLVSRIAMLKLEKSRQKDLFDEKMKNITTELSKQFKESQELVEIIKKNLEDIGYEI